MKRIVQGLALACAAIVSAPAVAQTLPQALAAGSAAEREK